LPPTNESKPSSKKKEKAMSESKQITRRHLLQGATLAGVVAVAPTLPAVADAQEDPQAKNSQAKNSQVQAPTTVPREAFETLSATESDLLEAIVERLIPSDAHGPGAKEARAAHYIDRALSGALAASRNAYASGLAALDRYAVASRGKPFLQLSTTDQDSVLIDCETGGATGFTGSSALFFAMVLGHTKQGMFGDPYYGGNANFVGWDLLNYPGVRTSISDADQKALEAKQLKPVRRSAYDYNGFNKATASANSHDDDVIAGVIAGAHHGD
jgi:gluconate 2-dehydrogenase gamma chain